MLKQTRSILYHKGIRINDQGVYLKPTRTIPHHISSDYWILCVFNLPLLSETNLVNNNQQEQKETLAMAIRKGFSGGASSCKVDPKNIYFETITRLSTKILNGNIIVLVEEKQSDKKASTRISSTRKKIYLTCYKRSFSIELNLVS